MMLLASGQLGSVVPLRQLLQDFQVLLGKEEKKKEESMEFYHMCLVDTISWKPIFWITQVTLKVLLEARTCP